MPRKKIGLVFGVYVGVFVLLVAVLGLMLNIQFVRGNGPIYIRADGSIDPPTAPISTIDNVTYTFADDIFDGVVVERSNIIIDGNGYTLNFGLGSEGGFYLEGINNVIIKNTNIIGFSIGVYLSSSNYTTVSANRIESNNVGIRLSESSDNSIYGNNIAYNAQWGISLDSSSLNTFYGNSIIENGCGARLDESSSNNFFHSNFINNNQQVHNIASVNVWDDGYPNGGNYWSDYAGLDTNGDGIGDTPHKVDENNKDYYPLMELWPDTTPPTTIDDYDGLWHTADFTVTLTAADRGGVEATYYRINEGQNKTVSADGQPYITTEGAKLEYWSVDNVGNEEDHHSIVIGLDKTPPTGSIIISADWKRNATYTKSASVTLVPNATDATSGVCRVRFSNDGVWDTETWEPWVYSMFKTWELTSGEGTKTVYAQFNDIAGWVSPTYQATIILDTTKPIADAGQDRIINMGVVNPFNPLPSVTFNASGSSDNFGIVSYHWNFGDGWTGEGKTVAHAYDTIRNYTVTLTVIDAAGNVATNSIKITLVSEGELSPGAMFGTMFLGIILMWIAGAAIVVIVIAIAVVLLIRKLRQYTKRHDKPSI